MVTIKISDEDLVIFNALAKEWGVSTEEAVSRCVHQMAMESHGPELAKLLDFEGLKRVKQ